MPRVRLSEDAPRRIIVSDDYGSPPYAGARRAVDEFFTDRPERLQFYPGAPGPRYFVTMGGVIATGTSAAVTDPRIPEERRAA